MATKGQNERSDENKRHSRNEARDSESKGNKDESSDLKKREYKDAAGNIHHHTRSYMEGHKGKGKDSD